VKSLSIIAAIILTMAGSAIVVAQTIEPEQIEPMPRSIIELKIALKKADRSKKDRNSVLRLERAEFYYSSAVEYYQAKWRAKALDYAHRGSLLVELHQRSIDLPGFYRPEQASAQQVTFSEE
jgi:hypothetical protein